MMDGISAMDTGNNGQMINMNIESIGEVKILTQGYQAEYGRASGLRITAVTKSGTNRFRGSAYGVQRTPTGTTTRWSATKNGDPKPKTESEDPRLLDRRTRRQAGRQQQALLLLCHDTGRPRAINNGNPIRFRVPTALERAGDFSQTLRQQRGSAEIIRSSKIRPSASAVRPTRRLFPDGGVVDTDSREPALAAGPRILNRYPVPNRAQARGSNYNYEIAAGRRPLRT